MMSNLDFTVEPGFADFIQASSPKGALLDGSGSVAALKVPKSLLGLGSNS